MVWLDAPGQPWQGAPNENLGRELMEVFTLGIGNYTEDDVKRGGPRADRLAGKEGAFHAWPPDHDDGEKTVLARRAAGPATTWSRSLLEHPATGAPAGLASLHLVDGREGRIAAAPMPRAAGLA